MDTISSRKVWYHGALRNHADIEFANNRAFRYGDGLIETMRMRRGELLFFHDHIERLFAGMQALMMIKPTQWDARFFYECISRLLIANQVESSSRIRLQVWRTGEGLYAPIHQGVDFLIETSDAPDDYVFNEKGWSADVVTSVRKTYDRLANVKTVSALTYVLAAIEAKDNNVDIGFVLNERNSIADATGRNVFIIEQGRVVTPPLQDAGVAGVLRMQLLSLLSGHKIITLEESITVERFANADEIFVTNVTDGIQPITSFAGKSYKSDQTKELFKLFMNHLQYADEHEK